MNNRLMKYVTYLTVGIFLSLFFVMGTKAELPIQAEHQDRMKWWREARFGLFIHWGLYAIPAGEWKGSTNHAEWIRHTAQIPIEEYDTFVSRFNPVKFDADEWVRIARDAGMKYIVITSKHHDGFCLFDSEYTDYDVMSTPFRRDIMKELAEACRREGLKICWYHSIMDWHHPDYLPHRDWEKRSGEGADFDRYITHLKNQVGELLTNYGPIGVMWFDGEWEGTWKHEYGLDLYDYCLSIQPEVIVNNRVDKGRAGMAGMTVDDRFVGDFGTPEQEIPATGLPGVDWETCMTMNRHWGYNRYDDQWKPSEDLIRKLADIVSKGGNFLLNVGPTALGEFPQESIARLRDMGRWMEINSEAIYGTGASPFEDPPWGRCTQKVQPDGGTRLYLHVFNWPQDGRLQVRGLTNRAKQAYLLADTGKNTLDVSRFEDALVIQLPHQAPDSINSVVVVDIIGRLDVTEPPSITAKHKIFIDDLDVTVSTDRENAEIRYTTDGSTPTIHSSLAQGPIRLTETTRVYARVFRDGKPVSGVSRVTFSKIEPRPANEIRGLAGGLKYEYYEGDWDTLPDFDQIEAIKTGIVTDFDFTERNSEEHFGFRYRGFVSIPRDGVYTFYTLSDDGSRLTIGEKVIVDNDGLHGPQEEEGVVALAEGQHAVCVTFFEKTGGDVLEVWYEGPGIEKQRIPTTALFHEE